MRVILNPAAGRATVGRIAQAMAVLGHEATLIRTESPGHATRLAAQAVRDRVGLVVAAGGDGTIGEVAAGLLGSESTLGLLPFGTANVLARELGVPLGSAAAARLLMAGHRATLHPGLTGDGRVFVQMVGAGFDAAVVAALDLGWKRRLGRLAYVGQSLREIRRPPPSLRLRVDGGSWEAAASAIVTKGRLYAGPYLIAPGASPLAPGFTLVTSERPGRLATLLTAGALPLSLLHHLPFIRLRRCRTVEMAGEGVAVQADGDAAGWLPITVCEARQTLQVAVPAKRPHAGIMPA